MILKCIAAGKSTERTCIIDVNRDGMIQDNGGSEREERYGELFRRNGGVKILPINTR